MYLKARVKENTITPFASKYASKCLHSYSALLYFCWKAMAIELLSILKAGAAQQLTVLSVELETHRKLLSSATTEKEKLEQRLQHLEKSLEDKSNECIFVAEESQVRLKFSFFYGSFCENATTRRVEGLVLASLGNTTQIREPN